MDNHFGKGLMAGLNASSADSARSVANFSWLAIDSKLDPKGVLSCFN